MNWKRTPETLLLFTIYVESRQSGRLTSWRKPQLTHRYLFTFTFTFISDDQLYAQHDEIVGFIFIHAWNRSFFHTCFPLQCATVPHLPMRCFVLLFYYSFSVWFGYSRFANRCDAQCKFKVSLNRVLQRTQSLVQENLTNK